MEMPFLDLLRFADAEPAKLADDPPVLGSRVPEMNSLVKSGHSRACTSPRYGRCLPDRYHAILRQVLVPIQVDLFGLMTRALRLPRPEELEILKSMVSSCDRSSVPDLQALSALRARDMPDGGTGSVCLVSSGIEAPRHFGGEVCKFSFAEKDGVPVSVTLNIDNTGHLYEIDFFKADGSALRRYPTPDKLKSD